jgi:hypothetical protein
MAKQYKNVSVTFSLQLELNFMDFYGVLLQFEKRMGVHMQKINLGLWIALRRGLTSIYFLKRQHRINADVLKLR